MQIFSYFYQYPSIVSMNGVQDYISWLCKAFGKTRYVVVSTHCMAVTWKEQHRENSTHMEIRL